MESQVRAKAKEVTFPHLHELIDTQANQIKTANAKILEQTDKMEELEDMVTALALTLKDLQSSANTPGGISSPTQRALTRPVSGMHKLDEMLTNGAPTPTETDTDAEETIMLPPIYGTCFGYLQKMSSGKMSLGRSSALTSWKKRWFVIQHDGGVAYYKTMADSTSTTSDKTELNLEGYTVEASPEHSKPFCIKLRNSDPAGKMTKRTFFLSPEPENDETQEKWIDAFQEAIAKSTAAAAVRQYQNSQTTSQRPSMSSSSVSGVNVDETVAALSRAAQQAVLTSQTNSPIKEDQTIDEDNEDTITDPVVIEPEPAATPIYQSWLERKSANGEWVRQYFILIGNEIIAFEDQDGRQEVSRKSVPGTKIDIIMEDDADGKECAFSIADATGKMTLNAEDDDMGSWVSELTNLAQSSK